MYTFQCRYINCEKDFNTKNPNRIFCCNYHKNQHHYLLKKQTYPWEIRLQKARNANIKILEELLERKITQVSSKELLKMGFDLKAAIVPDKNEKEQDMFRYGNIYLIAISNLEFTIVSTKK